MLLCPSVETLTLMECEVRDWHHPEHYATYMPEQEYLSRFYGTFERWTHVACCYNFEIDKKERIPHDWTDAHESIVSPSIANGPLDGHTGVSSAHSGAVVLHYSGTGVKPWKLLWGPPDEAHQGLATLLASSVGDLPGLLERYEKDGDGNRLDGYSDRMRLWAAMLEWFTQFVEAADRLHQDTGIDVVKLVQLQQEAEAVAAAATERKRASENHEMRWDRSTWARSDAAAWQDPSVK